MNAWIEPDWQGPLTTGMWQLVFHLDDDADLVFGGGGGGLEEGSVDRQWGCVLLDRKKHSRDYDLEEKVLDKSGVSALMHHRIVDHEEMEDMWVALQRDIAQIVQQAREQYSGL